LRLLVSGLATWEARSSGARPYSAKAARGSAVSIDGTVGHSPRIHSRLRRFWNADHVKR